MRFLTLMPVTLTLAACSPVVPESPPPRQATINQAAVNVDPIPVKPDTPVVAAPAGSPRFIHRDSSGITFEGVAFDSRNHRLTVADQGKGPGSRFSDAAAAARARGGVAAINAGFFTPEGDPLGLVVSEGIRAGNWNTASSLGSGVWHQSSNGRIAISRREALGRSGASAMRELIQAGPLLVENGGPVAGLEAVKSSVRTMILWDGGTRWWIGRASACTLSSLGHALATGQPAGWPARHALNLDGGRSSDLWVSAKVAGGPASRRPAWNRPVRNFLVLVPL